MPEVVLGRGDGIGHTGVNLGFHAGEVIRVEVNAEIGAGWDGLEINAETEFAAERAGGRVVLRVESAVVRLHGPGGPFGQACDEVRFRQSLELVAEFAEVFGVITVGGRGEDAPSLVGPRKAVVVVECSGFA